MNRALRELDARVLEARERYLASQRLADLPDAPETARAAPQGPVRGNHQGKRLSASVRDEARRRLAAGESKSDVARALGVTITTVSRYAPEHPAPSKGRPPDEVLRKRICQLAKRRPDLRALAIAIRIGCSPNTVRVALDAAGITIKRRPYRKTA